MFLFVAPLVCFCFLVIGAFVFLLCGLLPPLRRFALSAALWCAAWGPCVIAWMLFAGMVVFAVHAGLEQIDRDHLKLPQWRAGFGLGFFWLAVLATGAVATVIAWLHQVAIRRMTFALFRIYATIVTAGIGSVYGWALLLWIGTLQLRFGWTLCLVAMPALIACFGYSSYRWAKHLCGPAPKQFTWLTPEEFEGA